MSTSLNRRNALATLAAAVPTMGLPAVVAADDPDPIFALIERHKQIARVELSLVLQRGTKLENKYPIQVHTGWWDSAQRDSEPPENGSEPADWIESQLAQRDKWAELHAAAVALFTTKPTTIEGVVAVLEYAMQPEFFEGRDSEFGPNWCETVFGGGIETIEPVGEAAYGFLWTVAEALRDMKAKSAT